MARILTDGWADEVRGIGIDEETAVLLHPDGAARVTGAGAAWFLRMRSLDVRTCAPAAPLETGPIEAVGVRAGVTFDLSSWSGDGERSGFEAIDGTVRVVAP